MTLAIIVAALVLSVAFALWVALDVLDDLRFRRAQRRRGPYG